MTKILADTASHAPLEPFQTTDTGHTYLPYSMFRVLLLLALISGLLKISQPAPALQ